MKTFEDFREAMRNDETMKAEVNSLLISPEGKDEQAIMDLIVSMAVKKGYDVSVEDFTKALSGKQQLDNEELDLVSGGGAQRTCLKDYACWLAYNNCIASNECFASGLCNSDVE